MTPALVAIIHGADDSRPDEADTIVSARSVAAALARSGHAAEIHHVGLDLSSLVALAARRPLAIFNLVEAIDGAAALSYLPCPVMDHLGLAYTGARTTAYIETLSKLTTKHKLRARSLPTADWWLAGSAVPAAKRVIVKSVNEHGSLGLDAGSIVTGAAAAREIDDRQRRFGGQFFAEEFIEGREFNVAVLERDGCPFVLPIGEIDFSELEAGRPHIVDYDAKWVETSHAYHATPRHFGLETKEPALAKRLSDLAREAWQAFDMRGYARVDFRLGETGVPQILEINANPCISPDAGFVAAADAAGIGYDGLIAAILAAALRGAGKG